MDCSIWPDVPAYESVGSYRTRNEILHELVDTLNQVCHLLSRRADIKGSHRSIELGMAIRRIQHDAEYLREGLTIRATP